jgi:hypothetical protein
MKMKRPQTWYIYGSVGDQVVFKEVLTKDYKEVAARAKEVVAELEASPPPGTFGGVEVLTTRKNSVTYLSLEDSYQEYCNRPQPRTADQLAVELQTKELATGEKCLYAVYVLPRYPKRKGSPAFLAREEVEAEDEVVAYDQVFAGRPLTRVEKLKVCAVGCREDQALQSKAAKFEAAQARLPLKREHQLRFFEDE